MFSVHFPSYDDSYFVLCVEEENDFKKYSNLNFETYKKIYNL